MTRTGATLSLRRPAILVATWFGAGRLPGPKGTWGSLATLPVAWAALGYGGAPGALALAALLFAAGLWASGAYRAAAGGDDPQEIVIDESAGVTLALAGAAADSIWQVALAFALFRLFDIWKPGPVGWLERRPGAWGIMLDDMAAGALAAGLLLASRWIAG